MIAPISALQILGEALSGFDGRKTLLILFPAALFVTLFVLAMRFVETSGISFGDGSQVLLVLLFLILGAQIAVSLLPGQVHDTLPFLVWSPRHTTVFLALLGILLAASFLQDMAIAIAAGLEAEVEHFGGQAELYALAGMEGGLRISRSTANMALMTILFMPLFILMSATVLLLFITVPIFLAARLLPFIAGKIRGEEVGLGDCWRYTIGNAAQLTLIALGISVLFLVANVVGSGLAASAHFMIANSLPWTSDLIEMLLVIALNFGALMLSVDLLLRADTALKAVRDVARATARNRYRPQGRPGEAVGLV